MGTGKLAVLVVAVSTGHFYPQETGGLPGRMVTPLSHLVNTGSLS